MPNPTLIEIPGVENTESKRLFCFPFAGGGTVAFRRWTNTLSPNISLCLFNYPGREARYHEPYIQTLSELIELIYPLILEKTDKPFLFYGHSYGALVAYLIACKLQNEKGIKPERCFLSARRAPTIPNTEYLSNLPLQDFIKVISTSFQGIPDIILKEPSLLNIYMPIVQADFKMYEDFYKKPSDFPLSRLDCPFTIIGYQDDAITKPLLEAWQEQTSFPIKLCLWPGGHFAMLDDWDPIIDEINESVM